MNKPWSDRITELEQAGLSLTTIASEIGVALTTASDIKTGRTKEPRGMAAVKLDKLHSRVTSRARKPSAVA